MAREKKNPAALSKGQSTLNSFIVNRRVEAEEDGSDEHGDLIEIPEEDMDEDDIVEDAKEAKIDKKREREKEGERGKKER